MITKEMTIKEIVEAYPITIEVFNSKGLRGFDNQMILDKVGVNKLVDILNKKSLDAELFVNMLNEAITSDIDDITLNNNFKKEAKINVFGLLPCPVRLPLMEQLNKYEDIDNVNFELRAASEGLDFLVDEVKDAETEDDIADMFISAGFDLFFDEKLMKKFKDQDTFKDLTDIEFNKDFENADLSLKDPKGDYSVISVVPAVFLVNKKVLGDRPIPKTWEDLLDPIYKGSISLPVSDFDLFNAIVLHMYKFFGLDSVKKLGESLIQSLHPSEMVKSDRKSFNQPAISIMPYFFTKMAVPGGVMEAVWPEDGAIVSPIFMLTKQSKKEELKPLADILVSKEIGEILSHQGLFPSVNNQVDNHLENKPFKWVGWDYINNNDVGEILRKGFEAFNEGVGK